MKDKEKLRQAVRENYAKVALHGVTKDGCCGGGGGKSCCCGGTVGDIEEACAHIGYTPDDLASVPGESNMGLGCGNPVAIAALREGETVLDLGSGGGFDCFLARRRVGGSGRVIGVDMTPEMIRLARKNAEKSGYENVEFRLGEIEHLPVADGTADVILSNCVINLSPDKRQVFTEAYRVLKKGGRLAVSDVLAIRPLTDKVREDLTLLCGCVGGAEPADTVREMLAGAGFTDIRITQKENSREIVESWGFDASVLDCVGSFLIEAVKG